MIKHLIRFSILMLLVLAGIGWWATRPAPARLSTAELSGRVPTLGAHQPQMIPTVNVATAVGWRANESPSAARGLTVTRFAEGLDHPRQMLVLPNGDVLVAESNRPAGRREGGIRSWIEEKIMGRAGANVPSANRISLLRDADGDGRAEVKTAFLTGLNSPYGMALVGSTLYVANTDALMAYDYTPGMTQIATSGRKIMDLPAAGPNSHWTKSLAAGPDGILYVGVGSNSNIGEGGLAWERGRALVYEIRPAQNYRRTYASGLRNPSGLAVNPATGDIWAAVNERDMLGSDLVPDYVTRVGFGDFYGWPWYYWGGFVDDRVKEADAEDRRQYVTRPSYAVGAHVAPLGLSFANGEGLGAPFGNGLFVALHGSWNRYPAAGYKVIFIPFREDRARPADALPIDVLTGFLDRAGNARGRPTDARQTRDGALLVADDVGNIIWRVARDHPAATAPTATR